MECCDVLIVVGGPAGSSCAWRLRNRGLDVIVLERKRMPRAKLCAGWITPKVLADLKIQPTEYPHGMLKLNTIKTIFGHRHKLSITTRTDQYSIRRLEFDDWLLKRSGVQAVQHTVRRINRARRLYTVDDTFCCKYLVGAAGTNCPVRKNLFDPSRGKCIVTQEVEYETAPGHSVCTLWIPYAGSFGYAWYVPKLNAVNIGFGGLRSELKEWDRRKLWQDFIALLKQEGCIDDDPPQPTGYSYYCGRRTKRVRNANAYIVGDAAGLATSDLGEGIGPAVESGILAARDILRDGRYSTKSTTKYTLGLFSRALLRLGRVSP